MAPAAEVDQQTISGCEPQPGNPIDEKMQRGCEPQESSFDDDDDLFLKRQQERQDAFDDMCQLFLTKRSAVAVNVSYNELSENTRTYLRSLQRRAMRL